MSEPRVPLYDRLPEIYRIRDDEQVPPGQLREYLALVEDVFGAVRDNIEALYHDLFIETCDEWVIPYIGDLLGVTHLKGDPWTLRADVADAIALRRRKGTLAGIERLTHNLTRWGVHCVELRENLVWSQHLNHQRPDQGGMPPYGSPATRFTPVRGGTVTLRDPAMLSLAGTPFDPFAHMADLKPPECSAPRYNLPNMAIFLWRLEDHRVRLMRPFSRGVHETGREALREASHIIRFDVHPLGRPMRLFNSREFDAQGEPPVVTELDGAPGPIATPRLSQGSEAGRPEKYVRVDTYDAAPMAEPTCSDAGPGLQLHLPEPEFAGESWPDGGDWTIRGANLCGWETALPAPVLNREIVIDPMIGRVVIGTRSDEEAIAVESRLLLTSTYGTAGPVGAHPISRIPIPAPWRGEPAVVVRGFGDSPLSLNAAIREALHRDGDEGRPALVEIRDSLTHVLDLADPGIEGTVDEDGGPNLPLGRPLLIRAAEGERPIIQLRQPLRFRPRDAAQANASIVRLEGLYLAREASFPEGEPLIARAALHRLEIINCTLDPGGHRVLDGTLEGTRAPIRDSLRLREPYGFAQAAAENAFDQTPEIIVHRSITGPLLIDRGYRLLIRNSMIDAGQGPGGAPAASYEPGEPFAVSAAGDSGNRWGPPTQVDGVTLFGRMRVERLAGRGGIWARSLEVLDNQSGCIKFSYFCGRSDRLPPSHGCVVGTEARLCFVSEVFGHPGYAQLSRSSDVRIRECGPQDDAMGAFGFLREAHKWRNLRARYREFMPVGIRPLLIPVT